MTTIHSNEGTNVNRKTVIGVASAIAFILTIYAANWALATFGLVSIGFGLMAPAGVFFAGLAFTFRDVVHELIGRKAVVACILIGAGASYFAAGPFAVASGVAFLFSEMADFAVYDRLRRKGWKRAVALSNLAGGIVDSALFLYLAFGSLDFIVGQVVGKTYMTALALPLVWLIRKYTAPKVEVAR